MPGMPGGCLAAGFSALFMAPSFSMESLNAAAMIKLQRAFVAERNWGKFHTPKNLSMALAGEAAELMEIFQWLDETESQNIMKHPDKAQAVAHEMADVFYYLLRLADVLGVHLEEAFLEKMKHNRRKYPAKLARGNARKYNEFLERKGLNTRRRARHAARQNQLSFDARKNRATKKDAAVT
jgi:NTP pyrophosphatase (non-canonical NTP hydrolase)